MTSLIRPFAALRPRPDTAQSVIAPPYDVVDSDEARELAAGRPDSFLHISRPEIDLPPGSDPYSEAAYLQGARNLKRLLDDGVLERERTACFYAYRLATGTHQQTGLASVASVAAYRAGRIHAHELTRPDKENDRVRNIDTLNAQTGPVLLTYKADATVSEILAAATATEPLLQAQGQHQVSHSIWRIDAGAQIGALTAAFAAIGDLYIADGHHRSAAAARIADLRGPVDVASTASHNFFLSVAYPDDEMQVFDYNRTVTDLNGLSLTEFLAAVGERFSLVESSTPVKPRTPGSFGMCVARRWFALEPKHSPDALDPVARLDVSVLQRQLIAPILGVADPRTDDRIGFVGGVRGLEELERRVGSGKAAVAFALYPTSVRAMMAVADAGLLMPPKSTWFEPKLADGLLSHVLDAI